MLGVNLASSKLAHSGGLFVKRLVFFLVALKSIRPLILQSSDPLTNNL